MSRPRQYWNRIVRMILNEYPDKIDTGTVKGAEAVQCIRSALEDIQAMPDGSERLKLIRMVYINKSHKVYGAAMKLYISETTAKRWISDFVYRVAEKMGYYNRHR